MTHLTRVEAADDLQPSSRSAALPDRGPCPRGRRAAGRSLKNIQGGWRWPSSGGEAEAAMQINMCEPGTPSWRTTPSMMFVALAKTHGVSSSGGIDPSPRPDLMAASPAPPKR
eukprot:scaffold22048_cov64-Phaeocystis_antarctica.AAC.1